MKNRPRNRIYGMLMRPSLATTAENEIVMHTSKHSVSSEIVVAPGGYNESEDMQFNFYKKNNFVETEEPKLLKYNGKTDLIKTDCKHHPDCIMLMDNGICGSCIFYKQIKTE